MKKKGFTLVELLVVIAVIGILSAIITPNLLNARNSARIAAGQRFDSSVYHSIGDYLVGEWMFDVPSSALIDTSGMGYNGATSSVDASPTYLPIGGYNGKGAYSFDGNGDFINVSYKILSDNATEYSVSCWFNYIGEGFGSDKRIFLFETYPAYSTSLFINTDSGGNELVPSINYYDSTSGAYYDLGPAVSKNVWHHVVLTWKKGSYITLYLDGKFYGQSLTSDKLLYPIDVFRIGTYRTANDRWFYGTIDDMRVYAAALSSSEVEKLYVEGKDLYSNLANQ